jgi:hypothetical protein
VFEGEHVAGALSLIFFASAMTMDQAIAAFADDLKTAAAEISAKLAPAPQAVENRPDQQAA